MKNFYQGAALECEFCHRKFKEDELVIVTDTSRKVFCCMTSVEKPKLILLPANKSTDNSDLSNTVNRIIKDQLICVRGFEKQNPGFQESATVLIYHGGPCSCVDKSRKY